MKNHLTVSEETLGQLNHCPASRLHSVVMRAAIELGITDRPIKCGGDDRDDFQPIWEACLNRLDKHYAGWRGYKITLPDGTII